MAITKEQQSMLDDYNLYGFHSGGGCMHFAYDTNIDELQWLINDIEENGDPSLRYPKNENQVCVFGLDLNYLDNQNLTNSILKIGKDNKTENDNDADWINFQDTLKNGVAKMKAITDEINNLKEKV
tara:strand:- start:1332 stop:1709 length:378 start_codon:yes stop_codon:yes gene_type:complete